jgi:hypothetical protein
LDIGWTLLATSLLVTAHPSCSAETTPSTSAAGDAGANATTDVEEPPPFAEASVDARDSGFIPCTPGEEPVPCTAILSGCPSLSVCSERFGRLCPCQHCTFQLEPNVCFWKIMTDYADASWIDRIAADGGSQRLTRVRDRPCGDDEHGFFITWVPGTTTVTLCPGSCAEHEGDPSITFKLDRGPCPPS